VGWLEELELLAECNISILALTTNLIPTADVLENWWSLGSCSNQLGTFAWFLRRIQARFCVAYIHVSCVCAMLASKKKGTPERCMHLFFFIFWNYGACIWERGKWIASASGARTGVTHGVVRTWTENDNVRFSFDAFCWKSEAIRVGFVSTPKVSRERLVIMCIRRVRFTIFLQRHGWFCIPTPVAATRDGYLSPSASNYRSTMPHVKRLVLSI
jgi:hypothetical protein